MTAEALLDGALLSLGAGATGFAFFDWLSLDDGGKILALSTAVALAAPFEDLFFEGEPLTQLDIVATENILAWSGMQGQEPQMQTYSHDGGFSFAEKHAVSICCLDLICQLTLGALRDREREHVAGYHTIGARHEDCPHPGKPDDRSQCGGVRSRIRTASDARWVILLSSAAQHGGLAHCEWRSERRGLRSASR
jgi:hypothetical protein